MSLIEAISFLKGAVQKSMPGGATATYTFNDGFVYARNAAILAAYPVPDLLGTFGLAAEGLEAALGRFKSVPIAEAGDNYTIILKSGRNKATLALVDIEPPKAIDDREWQAVPCDVFEALNTLLPFVAKQGTWQRGIAVGNGIAATVNNKHAVEVTLPEVDTDTILISDECVEYLVKLPEPHEWSHTQTTVAFRWPNGAWVNCQLIAEEWPEVATRVLNTGTDENIFEITDEWRAAAQDAIAVSEGAVTISEKGFSGSTNHLKMDVEYEMPITQPTKWAIDTIKPVINVATRFAPVVGPSRFYGKNLRGIVAGLRL